MSGGQGKGSANPVGIREQFQQPRAWLRRMLLASALIVVCSTVLRRGAAAGSPMFSSKFEQPLTRRLQTSCHDLTDPLEELKTKRVISFGVFAQDCPVENNSRSGLTRTSAETSLMRRD